MPSFVEAFTGAPSSGKTWNLVEFGLDCFNAGYEMKSNFSTRFPARDASWSGNQWKFSQVVHLDELVEQPDGLDGCAYLIQEAYTEIDGRLFGKPLQRVMVNVLKQVGKGGSAIGWDSQRFDDPDIRLRNLTWHEVHCYDNNLSLVQLIEDRITGEMEPRVVDREALPDLGECYKTREKSWYR